MDLFLGWVVRAACAPFAARVNIGRTLLAEGESPWKPPESKNLAQTPPDGERKSKNAGRREREANFADVRKERCDASGDVESREKRTYGRALLIRCTLLSFRPTEAERRGRRGRQFSGEKPVESRGVSKALDDAACTVSAPKQSEQLFSSFL